MSGRGSDTDIRDVLHGKHDQVFTVAATNGDFSPGAFDGLYFHDMRHLSRLEIRLAGQPLTSLMAEVGDGRKSTFQLTNAASKSKDGRDLPAGKLSIRRERQLDDPVHETIVVENLSGGTLAVELSVAFDSDFVSVMHVRGTPAGRRGTCRPAAWSDSRTLVFAYDGADRRRRTTTVRFDPPPARVEGSAATYELSLEVRERVILRWDIELEDTPEPSGAAPPGPHLSTRPGAAPEAHRDLLSRLSDRTSARTSNPLFDRALDRAFVDLRMLATAYGNDTFFAAGIPWYVALFGRDSAVTAYELLAWHPAIARSTLDVLARFQATEVDDETDAEPGKILHELRVGEIANLHEIPQYPYYGSVDATPWFLILLGEYVQWTGDLDAFRAFSENVDRALGWIDRTMERDLPGFLDYRTRSSKGMRNQGWKDSWNGIPNEDGSPAEPPIALVEVQAYVHHGKRLVADLFRRTHQPDRADALEREAAALRDRVERTFWMPDVGYYALCVQKGGKLSRAIASNAGQCLFTRMPAPERQRAVADRLMRPDLSCGWGIRTLSSDARAYNPMDYQLGSVWPHDNALIALGLARCGFAREAAAVFSALFDAATRFPQFRLPEVFDGFAHDEFDDPVRYPVACLPQAWASGALPLLLQACLGLEPHALEGRLDVVQPILPDFLDSVTLAGLRVGAARVDLRFARARDGTTSEVVGGGAGIEVRRRDR